MTIKEKFELEYIIKTSPKVLENVLLNLDGLSEWFADDVNCTDDVYTFSWDGSEEQARLISKKVGEHIRWQWIDDEEDGLETYFEMKYTIDPMTKAVIFKITDFATKNDREQVIRLWESQILELRRVIGA